MKNVYSAALFREGQKKRNYALFFLAAFTEKRNNKWIHTKKNIQLCKIKQSKQE